MHTLLLYLSILLMPLFCKLQIMFDKNWVLLFMKIVVSQQVLR